jgi:hypothetical protein
MRKDEAQKIVNRSKDNPVWFIQNVLGVEYLTPQQIELCHSVRDNRRTASPAGHAVGKTFLAAQLVLWFLFTNESSKILTSAPTWFQVENLLWREIRKAHQQSVYALGGEVIQTQINLSEDWFAVGLSTNDAIRFQGIHAPRVMVIFDEATGIAPDFWEAAEGVAVGDSDRFLAIGNPTDPSSRFKTVCDSPLWNAIRLSAESHPNVLENKQIVPGAVTKQWVDERLVEYGGRDTSLYRARVRGLFPELGDDMLISLADVERAQNRWHQPQGIPVAVGCDVARFGADETVFIDLYADGTVAMPQTFHGKDTMQTAGRLKASNALKKGVDDAGVGGGVTDRLKEQKVEILAYNGGEAAIDSDRFLNRRAESWWLIREKLRSDAINLPPDNKLAADLTNIKYKFSSRGQIQLESKDDLKKRINRSPDRGDALAIALAAQIYQPKKPARFYSM